MNASQRTISLFVLCLALLSSALAFVPTPATHTHFKSTKIALNSIPEYSFDATTSSSNLVSVATVDPTTFLSDGLGGLIGSPAILAVPIVAALSVAGLIAFLIVSYANPADEDD